MDLADHVGTLGAEATRSNERRLIVLRGGRAAVHEALATVAEAATPDAASWVALGDVPGPWDTLGHDRSSRLLGRTIPGLVIDATESLRPNVIGQSVGAVAGGGLIGLLIGRGDDWVDGPLASDRRIAVPPYTPADVTSRFRRRFIDTLHEHRGVSVIDADGPALVVDGATGSGPPPPTDPVDAGATDAIDRRFLEACLTDDQRRCVVELAGLAGDDAIVVEAHRGRGKSAAAGLAAASFAAGGATVAVTGPGRDAVAEVFTRAADVLDGVVERDDRRLAVTAPEGGGRLAYHRPHELDEGGDAADVLIVDEAAALPVDRLRRTLAAPAPVAYLTTVHGYEGTGRGFAVRFRDHLDRSDRSVGLVRLEEPIRYRAGDPIETWQFRALLLDATPPSAATVEDAAPPSVAYRRIDRDDLVADEVALRELFGLLVLAHYRTEPDDLLRLLDAPNVTVRGLYHDGHPVCVAMLAEEGSLDDDWCDRLHAGESIRGHMIPDLLTTQLRDRDAGALAGVRVLRIATHDAVRRRGLGSRLLAAVHDEFAGDVDWVGAGFGATPELLAFWTAAGYRQIHLGTSRNPRSGEHSAVLLRPTSPAGDRLVARHERRLVQRLPGQLPDALRGVEPELVAATAAGIGVEVPVDVPPWMWDVVDATARGPGQVATAPTAFAQLALAGLSEGVGTTMTDAQRRLVVRRTLQAWPLWRAADELDLTLGDARATLREAIGLLRDWYLAERAG